MLISIAAPFAFIVTFFQQILVTIRELKTLFYFGISYAFLSALPIAGYFLADSEGQRLKFLILAVVAQSAIGAMIAISWFVRSKAKQHDPLELRLRKLVSFIRSNWREQFKYSIYLVAQLPMVLLAANLDKLIVMGFLSASSFAIYAIGALTMPLLPTLRAALVNTLVPEVADKYHETGKVPTESLHAWRRAIQLTALIIIPAFIFLEIFSHELIVGLYTIKYAESVPVFRAYLLLVPSYLLSFGIFFQGTGHTKPILISSIVFLITNVVLSLVLFRFLGMVGPAIGMVVANFIGAGYLWKESPKVIGEEPFGAVVGKDLLRILAESLGAGIIIKAILFFTCAHLDYLTQLVVGLAGSSGLVLIIWYFCRRDTLKELWALTRRILRK
jgi:O-antigen/teichoic acid export membrane protein